MQVVIIVVVVVVVFLGLLVLILVVLVLVLFTAAATATARNETNTERCTIDEFFKFDFFAPLAVTRFNAFSPLPQPLGSNRGESKEQRNAV
jgi:hypothetical protein